jgi:hypothetical protein
MSVLLITMRPVPNILLIPIQRPSVLAKPAFFFILLDHVFFKTIGISWIKHGRITL